MKKILVTLLAVMTVFAAFAVTPDLTLSGSGSFEYLIDEKGMDVTGLNTDVSASFELSSAATDANWSLAYDVALTDGAIEVTPGAFSLSTDLFDMGLEANKLSVTPAALPGLTVYYEDTNPDLQDVDKANSTYSTIDVGLDPVYYDDADKWQLADDEFGASYTMDIEEIGSLTVGGHYGASRQTVSAYDYDYYSVFNIDEDLNVYAEDYNYYNLTYGMLPLPIFKLDVETYDPLNYISNYYGVDASFNFAGVLEGLNVSASYGSYETAAGTDVTTETITATLLRLDDSVLNDAVYTNIGTFTKQIDVFNALTDKEFANQYMINLSYSNGYDVIDGLTVTPHGNFLWKTGYYDAEGTDVIWIDKVNLLRGESTGEASKVTFGPDVAFSMENISVAVNHDFTYKFAGDLNYVLDNASVDFSMDMVSAGANLKAWVQEIMSANDNDMSYWAEANVNATVTPVENLTLTANGYYQLDSVDESPVVPMGYSANVDYAFSPLNVGFNLSNRYSDWYGNVSNQEDMHWYAYVTGSFEF